MAHSDKLVTVFGEILWDEFPSGPKLGGAPTNFAVGMAGLGGKVKLISAVGDNQRGMDAVEFVKNRNVDVSLVQTISGVETGRVEIQLIDGEPNYNIVRNTAWDLVSFSEDQIIKVKTSSVFYFGSLAQRTSVSRNTLMKIVPTLSEDCLRVFDINIRQHYYDSAILEWSLNHCDLLKINEDEVGLLQFYTQSPSDLNAFYTFLNERYGITYLVITRGGDGCNVFAPGQKMITEPCPKITVCNTVGAGDAFTSGFITSYMQGKTIDVCAKNANSVGAFVASCDSATPKLDLELL